MDQDQTKACRMLFQIVSTGEPQFLQLKGWYFNEVLPTLDKWVHAEGNQGIKRMKDILFQGFLHILQEQDLEPLDYVKSGRDGVPTLVRPLVELCRRCLSAGTSLSDRDVRILNCALSLVRVTDVFLGVPSDVDLQRSLTHIQRAALTPRARREIDTFRKFVSSFVDYNRHTPFVKAFLQPLRIGGRSSLRNKMTYTSYSHKSGPNGPRTESAHRDIIAVFNETTSDGQLLAEALYGLSEDIAADVTGWNPGWFLPVSMQDFYQDCFQGFLEAKDQSSGSNTDEDANVIRHAFKSGKLSFKPEKSGKVRIIATPDYFTQEILQPIHNWLMGCLRAIPTDCTFDQRSSIPEIIQWQTAGRTVYSFDQTSCTDRFPVEMQLPVLGERFGYSLAEHVRLVMTDRDWVVKFPQSHQVKRVRWTVGQPLGAYASWPLMALTHHLLVQYCAWKARGRNNVYTPFKRYCICGDDIVIASKSVADCYYATVKLLGMQVNRAKSHVSGGKTGSPPVSEFAKIIVYKGRPLNPVRPHRVLSAVKDWRLMVPLLHELCWGEGWRLRKQSATRLILEYHPAKARILNYVLTVPTELGGVGLDSGLSLRDTLTVGDVTEIHPWLLFIATKIRNVLKLEARQATFSEDSIMQDVGVKALREHPFTQYFSELMNSDRLRYLSRGQSLLSVRDIACALMEQGPRYLQRVIDGLFSSGPSPVFPDEAADQEAKTNGSIWLEVLKSRSRHFPNDYAWVYPEPDRPQIFHEGHRSIPASTDRLVDIVTKYVILSHASQRLAASH